MAFFEIKDPNYNSDQIETEILNSLKNRNIPYVKEKEFVERYNLENAKKAYYSRPLTRFKILCNRIGLHKNMPRWIIRCAKALPFYGSIRKFLKIND